MTTTLCAAYAALIRNTVHTNRTHQPGPLLKSLLDHKLKLITSNKSGGCIHTGCPMLGISAKTPHSFHNHLHLCTVAAVTAHIWVGSC